MICSLSHKFNPIKYNITRSNSFLICTKKGGGRRANMKGIHQAGHLSSKKRSTADRKRKRDDLYFVEELQQDGRPKKMHYATATTDISAYYNNCDVEPADPAPTIFPRSIVQNAVDQR